MLYSPGQFSRLGTEVTPQIGNGGFLQVNPNAVSSASAWPNIRPSTPSGPNTNAGGGSLFKGGAAPITQVNPYGVNNQNGYHHDSNRWSGRQISDRQNPITRVDGKVVPLPAHATAGSTPRRPIIPAVGYGGTSQNNPNPGVGSMSVSATSGGVGSGSGKMMSAGTGLRGI